MKTNTLICLSLFAFGSMAAPAWAGAPEEGAQDAGTVVATPAKEDVQETVRDGLPVYSIHGREVAVVKKSRYHADGYDVKFTRAADGKGCIVKGAEVEIHIMGCAARHLAGVYQGEPFSLCAASINTPGAWLADFAENCGSLRGEGGPEYPYRRERARLRERLFWEMLHYVPGVGMDNFRVAADDFYILKDYAGARGDLRMMFNCAEPVLPTDGLFGGLTENSRNPELLIVYGGADEYKLKQNVAVVWGKAPVWTPHWGYGWQFAILMQRLQAIGVVKNRTGYLVFCDPDGNYYLYPATDKLPASPEDVRAGSRCIPGAEMRKLVAQGIDLMGGPDFLVGPPFRKRGDGGSFGYDGVDWDALTPENVNAHYVYKPDVVSCETDFPIIHAVKEGDVEHVRKCIEMGADLTVKCKENEADYDTRMTPLQIAAGHGYTEIVKLLVEAGADMERRTWWDSKTPLMLAASEGYTEIVRCLLEAGADPTRRCSEPGKDSLVGLESLENPDFSWDKWFYDDPSGQNGPAPDTALDFAVRNKHPECAELIRRYAAGWRPAAPAGVTIETIYGGERHEDTLIERDETRIVSLPGYGVKLVFSGYSCRLDGELYEDGAEPGTSHVINDIGLEYQGAAYTCALPPSMRDPHFDVGQAVSPSGKWVVLPQGPSAGYVVIPVADADFLHHSHAFNFELKEQGTHLFHEMAGWQDDDTLVLKIGLSGNSFTVWYSVADGAFLLKDHLHMQERITCPRKVFSGFIPKTASPSTESHQSHPTW